MFNVQCSFINIFLSVKKDDKTIHSEQRLGSAISKADNITFKNSYVNNSISPQPTCYDETLILLIFDKYPKLLLTQVISIIQVPADT